MAWLARGVRHAGGALTIAAGDGPVAVLLAGDADPFEVTGLEAAKNLRVVFIQDSVGGRAVAFPVDSPGGWTTVPVVDEAARAVTPVMVSWLPIAEETAARNTPDANLSAFVFAAAKLAVAD